MFLLINEFDEVIRQLVDVVGHCCVCAEFDIFYRIFDLGPFRHEFFFSQHITKMATFNNQSFIKHDAYMTPNSSWDNIKNFIPKNKVIWEAFYGDGKSGEHLKKLGFEVVHEPIDFFDNDKGDVVVSNPPFSKCAEVLKRLVKLDKPFILILPSSKINTQYFRQLFYNNKNKIKLIIPRKRIQFDKKIDGKTPDGWKNSCNFDCFYYCWQIDTLDSELTWLK